MIEINKSKAKGLKQLARFNLMGRYGTFAGAYVLTMLLSTIIEYAFTRALGPIVTTWQNVLYYVAEFLIALIILVLNAGMIYMNMERAKGGEVKVSMVFRFFKNQPDKFILGGLLSEICLAIAMLPALVASYYFDNFGKTNEQLIILIVCAIISLCLVIFVALSLFPLTYLLVDEEDLKVMNAFSKSWALMKGNRGKLLYLTLSFIPMILLGALSFGLGFLWISPYMNQTTTLFYLEMTDHPATFKIPEPQTNPFTPPPFFPGGMQ